MLLLLTSGPSVIKGVLVTASREGNTFNWKIVRCAHCQASDSFKAARHSELCRCGSCTATANIPRWIGTKALPGVESLPAVRSRGGRSPLDSLVNLFKKNETCAYLCDECRLAAIRVRPTTMSSMNCKKSRARMRCLRDMRCQIHLGKLGRGFSNISISVGDAEKTSFSTWSGLSIGAEALLHRSKGTASMPSSICLIKQVPE